MAESLTWESIHAYLRSETHHGKPGLSQAKKVRLARALSGDAVNWALRLKDSDDAGAREIAAVLLAPLWAGDDRWEASVLALAQDADWEVREWATEPFVACYRSRPDVAHERFVRWCEGASPTIKRAIAVASRTLAADPRVNPEHLLTWADAMAPEEDPYVRKNLGPFAIGDGLLPRFPDQALRHLSHWVRHPSWAARWNAAMAFSARRAAPFWDGAEAWVRALTGDDDGRVRRAAQSVLKRLGR